MKGRRDLYVLAGLVVLLAAAGYYFFTSHSGGPVIPGVLAADTKFQPLNVQEPALRLDLLDKIHRMVYDGSHRNIFVAEPPPIPKEGPAGPAARPVIGPKFVPPAPLVVPVEFFGYATPARGGRRAAFFTSGDDVLIVSEGDTLLGRFRVDRVNNDTVDVEEISSGRHTTLRMVQPPDQAQGLNP
ncbi:MAG TPA: hypothetical protein VMM16_14930 [Verrucomicrobiae bacterium]|nr:hypothetical protein [Verrucomicrobiae bacterium]